MIVYFIPAVGHLIAQSEPYGEIRSQLHLILEIHGGFERSESQRLRIHRRQKLRRPVLQEFRQAQIADSTGVILCRGERGLPNALKPRTHTQVMPAARDPQIVRPGIVSSLVVVQVLAIGRNYRRWSVRRLRTSKNDCARGASTLAAEEEQVRGKRLER